MTKGKTTKSKVAIIGLANIGQVVATNLINADRPVILAARDIANAKKLLKNQGI